MVPSGTDTMLKIKISDACRKELNKFNFDVEKPLSEIIKYIPRLDLIGLDFIYVTDKPEHSKKHLSNALGIYFQKQNNSPAYVEIYLSRIFGHINSAEHMKLIMPILNIGLAHTVFHEVGHHFHTTKSHGIKKSKREQFADHYANNLLSKYLVANTDSINSCFENLEEIADQTGLSHEKIEQIKKGWEKQFNDITK